MKTAFYANWGPASREGLPRRPPSHCDSIAWLGVTVTPSHQATTRVSGSGLRVVGEERLEVLNRLGDIQLPTERPRILTSGLCWLVENEVT